MTDEEFPFTNQFYDLISGKTISRRGQYWTALLLVKTKPKKDENSTTEEIKSDEEDDKKKRKVIIQRWRRFKQGEDGHRWGRSKDFTISSKKQWNELKESLDEWVDQGEWG